MGDFGARAAPNSSTVSNDGLCETKEASSLYTEWTDEKHSLYLKSMEASFVNQLYDSTDMLGFCRLSDPTYSKKKRLNTRTTSGQFKVLRGGCWQKINFARAGDLQLKKAEGSRVLLANPWIRHFRTGCKTQVVAPADEQSNAASTHEALGLVGNHATCNSKHIHACQFHLCHRDLVGSSTEVSDQNFVDEVEGGKENDICNGKRMKSCSPNASSSNDQVVPHNNSSTTEDVTKNCISAARCKSVTG